MKFRVIKGIGKWVVQEKEGFLFLTRWVQISVFDTQEEAVVARDFYEEQEKRK